MNKKDGFVLGSKSFTLRLFDCSFHFLCFICEPQDEHSDYYQINIFSFDMVVHVINCSTKMTAFPLTNFIWAQYSNQFAIGSEESERKRHRNERRNYTGVS